MKTKEAARRFLQRHESPAMRRCGNELRRRASAALPKLAFLALGLCGLPSAHAAKITVDNPSGGSVFGACTLLDAVISANIDSTAPGSTCEAGNGADTIVFKSGITRIVFSQPANFLFPDALLVTDTLTIDGGAVADSGVPAVTLSRSTAAGIADFRLIETISPLTLNGIALENGHLSRSGEFYCGGAIRVASEQATLNIRDGILRNNGTEGDGALGGAVCGAFGDWYHVTVTGNYTHGSAAHGGGISAATGYLSLYYSNVDGNTTSGPSSDGGGIYTDQYSAVGSAGSLILFGTEISHNKASGKYSRGGGIFGLAELLQSGIDGNESAADGGGIFSSRGVYLGKFSLGIPPSRLHPASSISANHSGARGGGVYVAGDAINSTLTFASVHHNTADGDGGGVYVEQPALLYLSSATVSSNTASGDGGGLFFERNACFSMKRATISANQVLVNGVGAGVFHGGKALENTGCSHEMDLVLLFGNLGSRDLDTDDTSVTDLIDVTGQYDLFGRIAPPIVVPRSIPCDPRLGPLADNGGNTLTHALPADSCAVDQAPTNGFSSPDQRGPGYLPNFGVGALVDVGAYEVQPTVPDGACSNGNGGLYASIPPTADLCISGIPSTVLASNDGLSWSWTCGEKTECSASKGSRQWTITPSTVGSGTVSPDGAQTVVDGGSLTFDVAPSAAAQFASYTYCGQTTNVPPYQDSVTLSSIHADCKIVFNFAPLPAPQNGICGSDNGKTLNTAPTHLCDAGTPSLLGGGGPWQWSCARVNASGKTAACATNVNAVASTHQVTASAGIGGAIAPAGTQIVADGGILSFAITPDPGYVTTGVSGCGGHLSASVYITASITADCVVTASFAQVNARVDGVCGSDNGKTLSAAPLNLCNTGTPSSVLGNGPWSWSCLGGNGGTDAACAAQKLETQTSALVGAPALDRWALALLLLSLGGVVAYRRSPRR